MPRLLNSEDIPALHPGDPQPLFAPEHDFTGDNFPDIAISGIYPFESTPQKYFLLVATPEKTGHKFQKLYYAEYTNPVYIHATGTTGEADPKDQAFSISSCYDCDDGFDFYWNKRARKFDLKRWTAKVNRIQKQVEVPAKEVPAEEVDKALQVAGKLKDVTEFTAKLKEKNGTLGVRVEFFNEQKSEPLYWVRVFEKKGNDEVLYDRILVNTKEMKVIKREKKKR